MTDIGGLLSGGLNIIGRTVRQLPLADDVLPILAEVERAVVRAVRDHLAELEPAPAEPVPDEPVVADRAQTPMTVLRELLERSMYSSPDVSRDALYLDLLDALLPDEARILAALSDGSAYPVIHVAEPGIGTNPTILLRNASTVGRSAGVSLPQYTPHYVTRLLAVGLVRLGPEATVMHDEYDRLLTDVTVRSTLVLARRGMRGARVIRQTLRMSDLGQELWEAAK